MPYKILKLRHFQSGKGLEIELPVDCTFLHVSCQKPWKTLFEKGHVLKYINSKLWKIVLGNSARSAKSIHVMCSTLKFHQGLYCNQADRREAQGIEVYVQQPNSKTNSYLRSKSENLGESLLSEFDKALGFKIRGLK